MKISFFRPGTVTRISVGVAALVVMLLMSLDFAFGLIPDPAAQALERRQIESELLAERVTQIATQTGAGAVNAALHAARLKDRHLLSAGLRRSDGALLASTAEHAARWAALVETQRRRTQVTGGTGALANAWHGAQALGAAWTSSWTSTAMVPAVTSGLGSPLTIPVRAHAQPWGQLELAFDPVLPSAGALGWLPLYRVWPALAFIGLTGLLRLYLGRVLHQLDPTSVVPERVRTAYNALTESVVMVDAQGRVVLSNSAFQSLIAPRTLQLGRRLEDHPWFASDARFDDLSSLPWRVALRSGQTSSGDRLWLDPAELGPQDPVDDSVEPDSTARESIIALVNCTPIVDDRERVQGCLVVFQDQTDIERTNDKLQRTLQDLQVAHAQISEQHEEMMRLATLDPLTSCMNRRAFYEAARGQMQRCLFDGAAVAVIMVDIDHFKNFNDRYGHAIGDEVIKAVANLLQTESRPEDLVCRYGGEEFCVLLPESDETVARIVAERLRHVIEAGAGAHIRDMKLTATASLGVAVSHSQPASLEALIELADQALYTSKRNGRNRVTLYDGAAAVAPPERPASALALTTA